MKLPPLKLSSSFPTDHFKAVLLLQSFIVCASVVSYLAFVLSLFIPHLSFFWCFEGLCILIVAFPGYLHFIFTCPHQSDMSKERTC